MFLGIGLEWFSTLFIAFSVLKAGPLIEVKKCGLTENCNKKNNYIVDGMIYHITVKNKDASHNPYMIINIAVI